jgi:hypothetical protein
MLFISAYGVLGTTGLIRADPLKSLHISCFLEKGRRLQKVGPGSSTSIVFTGGEKQLIVSVKGFAWILKKCAVLFPFYICNFSS